MKFIFIFFIAFFVCINVGSAQTLKMAPHHTQFQRIPETIRVPADYPTIQMGIDAAFDGDTVLVAPGTYYENIVFKGKAITVKSSAGAIHTTIDGNKDGGVIKFMNSESRASILQGFKLTNGSGTMFIPLGIVTRKAGGAIFCDHATPTIVNKLIIDNAVENASHDPGGGGIYSWGIASSPLIINNTIVRNKIYAHSNTSGGIGWWNGSPIVINTIVRDNIPGQIDGHSGSITVEYSNVQDHGGGVGNINVDPLFVDVGNNDYHLSVGSPCIDVGTDDAPYLTVLDCEGDPRKDIRSVDIGVDEYYTHLYYTGSSLTGATIDVQIIGLPWTSPVVLWYSLAPLDVPLNTDYGKWFLQLPIFDLHTQATIPMTGFIEYPITIPQIPKDQYYLQAFVGDVLSNLCVIDAE